MPKPAPVLVYGADSSLLRTRQMVLETIGGEVHATTHREVAERMVAEVKLRLLVLCYTLSPQDREGILRSVHNFSPDLKILALKADGPPLDTGDQTFNIFYGPAALKSRVQEMLREEAV